MNKLLASIAIALLAGAACGDSGGSSSPDAQSAPDAGLALGTAAQIQTWMNGKTFKMEGANIPAYPNGYNEDANFGAATQCYVSVTMVAAANNLTVTSILGTLEGASTVGSVGTCNHTTQSGMAMFASTNILIENVMNNAQCFDITVTYPGFMQEGRGKIDADGKKLTLELYFANMATGHRCAAGAVGAQTVTLNGKAFTGDAQQVYVVQ